MSTQAKRNEIGKKFFQDKIKKFKEGEAKKLYIQGRFHGKKPFSHMTNVPSKHVNQKPLSVQNKKIQKMPAQASFRKRKRE